MMIPFMIKVEVKDTMGQVLPTVAMRGVPSKDQVLKIKDNTGLITSYHILKVIHHCDTDFIYPSHHITIIVMKGEGK